MIEVAIEAAASVSLFALSLFFFLSSFFCGLGAFVVGAGYDGGEGVVGEGVGVHGG